jgi:streptomycin 3"-adenylyltransferase
MDAGVQLAEVLSVCRAVLDRPLLGAYLHGSAALGMLHPDSDLDVLAVVERALTNTEKRELVNGLKNVSEYPAATRRPVEVTVVVHDEIRPWRYPPRMDLQYGEWLRDTFEGDDGPWEARPAPDLASLITMVILADRPLFGPPPAGVFDLVPAEDYIDAIVTGIDGLVTDLEWDTRNVVLTLVRIWSTVSTGAIRSKDAAAAWACARLPAAHWSVVDRARRAYLGEITDDWGDELPSAGRCVEHLLVRINDRLAEPSTLPTSIRVART